MTDNKQSRKELADAGAAEVQKNVDKETEQGFRGVEVDPTPNSAYSVEGVTSGAPTPETDKEHKRLVADHVAGVEAQHEGNN